MQRRSLCRAGLCLALGLACLSQQPARTAAQPDAPALGAELTRVAEINQRRRALSVQLARQRVELLRDAQQGELLQKQLDAPAQSVEAAPAARARLLDQLADALGSVVYLTGQLQSGHEELSELDGELSELLHGAAAEATATAADPAQRVAAMKAKQRALMLKNRAKLGPALPDEAGAEKRTAELTAWKQQQRDASTLLTRTDAEPRFASLMATPPRNLRVPPPGKRGKVETLRACSVREVDWKNITFDVGGRSVQLLDGQGPLEPHGPDGSVNVRLKDVSYGDSNGNGREEVFLLVDREEVSRVTGGGEEATEVDGLYVLESAADCSMRRLADVVLTARAMTGKPVSGGYDHDARDAVRELRWVDGVLQVANVRSRLARVIR